MQCLHKRALQEGLSLFGLVPKCHAMAHFKMDANDMLRPVQKLADGAGDQEELLLNHALFDYSGNEDFVGRISKQSRRSGFRKVLKNLMRAYLVKFKFVAKRHFDQRQRCERKCGSNKTSTGAETHRDGQKKMTPRTGAKILHHQRFEVIIYNVVDSINSFILVDVV